MKSVLLAVLISFSMVANASDDLLAKKGKKSEPPPADRDERTGGGDEVDPRQETYEGNGREGATGGGYFDGGGYGGSDGTGGGMIGEIFRITGGSEPVTSTKIEDRGDVVVYTTVIHKAVSPTEVCTTESVIVVDKKTNKVVSSESAEYCNHLSY